MNAPLTASKAVSLGRDFVPIACWFAEHVADFYRNGTDHDEFRFIEDELDVTTDSDSLLIHKVVRGYVLNVIDKDALREWDSHQHWFSWRYDITFHLTPAGLAGDIVIYSGWGASFFFAVNPETGVRIRRVKASCLVCDATSNACACP